MDQSAKLQLPPMLRKDGRPFGAPPPEMLALPPMPTTPQEPFACKTALPGGGYSMIRVPYVIMRAMYAFGPFATMGQRASVAPGLTAADIEACVAVLFPKTKKSKCYPI